MGQTKQVIKIENIKLVKKGGKEKILLHLPFSKNEQHGKGPVLEIYVQICSCICPVVIIPPFPGGGERILFYLCPSFRSSTIFFSATIDGRNLIFGHKLHIGMPYCG